MYSLRLSGWLFAALLAAACTQQLPDIPEAFDPETPPEGCAGKCDGAGSIPRAALPAATLATRFAPYEPGLALDLALIDEVAAARATDPAVYPEGANPYRIRYAVYNLRNLEIIEGLADAADAGVDVQILIEDHQLDPDKTWNVADEMLIARGFEFAPDHRALDAEGRRTADLVGITGSGLMHLKARLYEWPAGDDAVKRLVTGSHNPGDNAVNNDETLHYLEDPAVIAAYERKYDAILEDRTMVNEWRPGAAVQALFTPDDGPQPVDEIARLIDEEDELILIAVFSLRNVKPTTGGPGILERLAAAHARGVPVVVITDRKQSDGVDADGNQLYWNDHSEEILRDAGVPLYEVINDYSPFNAMHTKYGIFGLTSPIVVTDASNWTRSGLGSGTGRAYNDESVLFIDTIALDGGVTGQRYLGNFVEILHRYGTGTDHGGPAVADTLALLHGLEAWPAVTIEPAARAETAWGQHVHLTGNLDVLGDWTRAHPGWPLTTDASSYPLWHGPDLTLPLGTRADYKLIKAAGDQITWERGANRRLIADPTDMRVTGGDPAAAVTLDDEWRD